MSDDAATLRAAALKMGIELPPGDKSTDSEAHAFAKRLEAGGVGGQMSAGHGAYMPAPSKYAAIPAGIIPASQPLPPPMAPGGTVAAPDGAAVMRQRAMLAQQQAMGLQAQRPGYAQIPTSIMPQGGALPPPMPPQGVGPSVMSPQEVAAFKARLAADTGHCDCKEKA